MKILGRSSQKFQANYRFQAYLGEFSRKFHQNHQQSSSQANFRKPLAYLRLHLTFISDIHYVDLMPISGISLASCSSKLSNLSGNLFGQSFFQLCSDCLYEVLVQCSIVPNICCCLILIISSCIGNLALTHRSGIC